MAGIEQRVSLLRHLIARKGGVKKKAPPPSFVLVAGVCMWLCVAPTVSPQSLGTSLENVVVAGGGGGGGVRAGAETKTCVST